MTSQHSIKYMVRRRYFDSISAEPDDVANLRAKIAKTGLQLSSQPMFDLCNYILSPT